MSEIKALRRVSAYSTTDDKLHSSRVEAERHQARLDIRGWIDSMPELKDTVPIDVQTVMCESAEFLIDRLRQATKPDPKPKKDAGAAPATLALDAA